MAYFRLPLVLAVAASNAWATTTPLPELPAGSQPVAEYARAQELWLSLGGATCFQEPELLDGSWDSFESDPAKKFKFNSMDAKANLAAGPIIVDLARTMARTSPVRVFVDEKCSALASSLANVPGVTLEHLTTSLIWIRDYAPFWLRSDSGFSLIDVPYMVGNPYAPIADAFPTAVAKRMGLPVTPIAGAEYQKLQGGALLADSDSTCLFNQFEPASEREAFVRLLNHMGCKSLIALEALPQDSTGHIDLSVMIGPGKTAFVAEFKDPRDLEIQTVMERNYRILEHAGYRLERLETAHPEKNQVWPDTVNYYSYANALLNGDTAFVPQYQIDLDSRALAVYERAGFRTFPVPSRDLAEIGGAVHCISQKAPAPWPSK